MTSVENIFTLFRSQLRVNACSYLDLSRNTDLSKIKNKVTQTSIILLEIYAKVYTYLFHIYKY